MSWAGEGGRIRARKARLLSGPVYYLEKKTYEAKKGPPRKTLNESYEEVMSMRFLATAKRDKVKQWGGKGKGKTRLHV